jgi:hypothetical protein
MSSSTTRLAGVGRSVTVPRHTSGCGHGGHIPRQAGQSPAATTATEAADSTERKVDNTKRDLAVLLEEAAAGMRRLTAAMPPSPGTGGAQTQDPRQAASRLFEGVMATNKRFADALLERAEPGPAVELQRRFVGEWFDALARGGTLLLRAAGEAAPRRRLGWRGTSAGRRCIRSAAGTRCGGSAGRSRRRARDTRARRHPSSGRR